MSLGEGTAMEQQMLLTSSIVTPVTMIMCAEFVPVGIAVEGKHKKITVPNCSSPLSFRRDQVIYRLTMNGEHAISKVACVVCNSDLFFILYITQLCTARDWDGF